MNAKLDIMIDMQEWEFKWKEDQIYIPYLEKINVMYFICWHITIGLIAKMYSSFSDYCWKYNDSVRSRMFDPLGRRMAKISSSPIGKIYRFGRTSFLHQVK